MSAEWYDIRNSSPSYARAATLDTIRIAREWAFVAYQDEGRIEVYVNGVKVLTTSNTTEAINTMRKYREGILTPPS
jgi:hypothetical protein